VASASAQGRSARVCWCATRLGAANRISKTIYYPRTEDPADGRGHPLKCLSTHAHTRARARTDAARRPKVRVPEARRWT
jgi:hypothetical protein